jgi:carbon-monoxide dehydrogenase small subunit
VKVSINVNGQARSVDVEPRTLLVQVIRDNLGLTGTHVGCETSQCGACTVHLNGNSVKSCTILAVQAEGCDVTTIEGIAPAGMLDPIQQAFWEEHGVQCGYCTSGMIMSAKALLSLDPNPDAETIRHWLEGNLCRCTGYQSIVKSIQSAAEKIASGAVAGPVVY